MKPLMFRGQEVRRIPPDDPIYQEASLVIGQRRTIRGVEVLPMPDDDSRYNEASLIVGQRLRPPAPPPVEQEDGTS